MSKKIVWIDTDCGVDDALALLCACALEDIEIVGVSAGVGTTTLANTFKNTRNVLSLAGRADIPVYPGAASAWIEPFLPAVKYHGEDGLGGAVIPESTAPVEEKAAWDALYEAAKKAAGELIVITIGQLTNLANTIVKYPDFVNYVKEIDIMGGAIVGGNTTICSEANIRRDPQAAQCVFKCGVPIHMFGLDVTEKAYLNREDLNELFSVDTPVTRLVKEATKIALETNRSSVRGDTYTLHDLCPVLYQQYPELFKGKKAGVYVETQAGLTYGKTISDIYTLMDNRLPAKNVNVMLYVDREEMVKIVKKCLLSY